MPATATQSEPARRTLPTSWALLQSSGGVEVAAATEQSPRRRVKAKLYSGNVVQTRLGGMPVAVDFIIDLATLQIPEKPIPIRHEDHDGRVGVWDRMWVDSQLNEVWGEGYLLTNPDAQRLAQDADEGFPFETSLKTTGEPVWVPEGRTVAVNGRQVKGPAVIGRNGLVREASILTLGADSNTTAAILAEGSATVMADDATSTADTDTDTAELESVAVEDITADWLREHKPDLVEALIEAAAEAGDGAEPAAETAEMAQPATLAELKALKVDSDSVLWALENKLPLAHAKATFEFAERRLAALEATGADPATAPGAPAAAPTGSTTAQLAEDPAKAWTDSEPLRNYWKDRGGRDAFLRFCQLSADDRTDWRTDLAPDLA